jgi:hypothetical protein
MFQSLRNAAIDMPPLKLSKPALLIAETVKNKPSHKA